MSLQWTLVATFLYAEILVVIFLLLPFISPTTWHRFFKSRFLRAVESQANIYFTVFFIILVLLFLDSIREMKKYTAEKEHEAEHGHLDAELQHSMRLFRAQRNFYIAGFALFLSLVIRRLVSLISAQATLIAQTEASMKQAQGATDAAQRILKERNERDQMDQDRFENVGNVQREEYETTLAAMKDDLNLTNAELTKTRADFLAMKAQAESTSRQFDELLREHERVQRELEKRGGEVEPRSEANLQAARPGGSGARDGLNLELRVRKDPTKVGEAKESIPEGSKKVD